MDRDVTGHRTRPDHTMIEFLRALPKVELHLHLEGTLEPEMASTLAERNKVDLGYADPEALRAAYRFTDLQSFLDLYYEGTSVLVSEQDFYDLTCAYLERAQVDNIRHAEVFFDPQTHTSRGIPFGTVITGIRRGLEEGERAGGVTSRLILCFLRDRSLESAWETFRQARPYREWITAVGLDSTEVGYPPERFREIFAATRAEGWRAVAHAGEEGPPEYIWGALDALSVERIDHGIRCLEDPVLVARMVAEQIPLTVCPLSNVCLGVFDSMAEHNLQRMLDAGLRVTVNSDDPAYFGGYLVDNLAAIQQALDLGREQIITLVRNSYAAAFVDEGRREEFEAELAAVLAREA